MKKYVMILALLPGLPLMAQQQEGKKNVEQLCGCFDVEFKYAETFSPDKEYKFHERETMSGGTEYIFPVESTDKRLVLQHLLVISDSMIIKHWREEWTYENPVLWKYAGHKTWVKVKLDPAAYKGKWTQSVWEVSDAPRYQGIAGWTTTDGQSSWQSTADAPLPRREYSIRSDYNILKRENNIVLRNDGWIHDQDNQKIIREQGNDKLLVEEKGLNTYKRQPDTMCAPAKLFWEKNMTFWTKVRKTWENYLDKHDSVSLLDEVNGKVMHQTLMDLAKDYLAGKLKDVDASIEQAFYQYVVELKKDLSK